MRKEQRKDFKQKMADLRNIQFEKTKQENLKTIMRQKEEDALQE